MHISKDTYVFFMSQKTLKNYMDRSIEIWDNFDRFSAKIAIFGHRADHRDRQKPQNGTNSYLDPCKNIGQ